MFILISIQVKIKQTLLMLTLSTDFKCVNTKQILRKVKLNGFTTYFDVTQDSNQKFDYQTRSSMFHVRKNNV